MLMQAAPVKIQTWQGLIILSLFLLAFGYLGWKRGARRELATLMFIVIGYRLWTTSWGDTLVGKVNQLWFMAHIALKAKFDINRMMEMVAQIKQMKPLISDDAQDAFLFFVFLFFVFLGYAIGHIGCCIGSLLRKILGGSPSLVGGLLGMLNGYLLVQWLFPTLITVMPSAPPGRPVMARAAESTSAKGALAQGFAQLAKVFGLDPAHFLLILVGLTVLIIAWKSR